MSRKIFTSIAAVAFLAVGCGNPTVTTIGGNDSTPTPTPNPTPTPGQASVTLALASTTIDSDIGIKTTDPTVVTVGFTVTPSSGFTGSTTVHVTGLPAGVVIADVPVTISGTAPVTGTLVIDASDVANAIPGSYTNLSATASNGTVTSAPVTFTLNLAATYHVDTKAYPAGTQNARDFWGPDPTVAGSKGLVVHLGNATSVTVIWKNNDGVNNHEIHRGANTDGMVNPATFPAAADLASDVPSGGTSATVVKVSDNTKPSGQQGDFPHGTGAIAPGGTNTRVFTPVDPTAVTVMDFHCHVHNAMPGRITIMP
ncbi:MAG TPA: hypothetical protein VMV18_04845 [bacterium]|nr:hypothetical protein [bacterium]